MALGRTRQELLATIAPDELKEWMAYDNIEPFGAPVQDLQSAMNCYLLAWIFEALKASAGAKDLNSPKLEDFQIIKGEQKQIKEMNWKVIQNVFKKIAGFTEKKKDKKVNL